MFTGNFTGLRIPSYKLTIFFKGHSNEEHVDDRETFIIPRKQEVNLDDGL